MLFKNLFWDALCLRPNTRGWFFLFKSFMFAKWYFFWKEKELKLGCCCYLVLWCALCKYMCAQMCKCVWRCVWTWACGGQKLALSVHKLLFTIHARSLTWTQDFLIQPISLANFLRGSDLCLLCTGVTGSCHVCLKFKCALGIWIFILMHEWQAPTHGALTPAPESKVIKKAYLSIKEASIPQSQRHEEIFRSIMSVALTFHSTSLPAE